MKLKRSSDSPAAPQGGEATREDPRAPANGLGAPKRSQLPDSGHFMANRTEVAASIPGQVTTVPSPPLGVAPATPSDSSASGRFTASPQAVGDGEDPELHDNLLEGLYHNYDAHPRGGMLGYADDVPFEPGEATERSGEPDLEHAAASQGGAGIYESPTPAPRSEEVRVVNWIAAQTRLHLQKQELLHTAGTSGGREARREFESMVEVALKVNLFSLACLTEPEKSSSLASLEESCGQAQALIAGLVENGALQINARTHQGRQRLISRLDTKMDNIRAAAR